MLKALGGSLEGTGSHRGTRRGPESGEGLPSLHLEHGLPLGHEMGLSMVC